MEVRKKGENAAIDGFGSNFSRTVCHEVLRTYRRQTAHKSAGYDDTSSSQLQNAIKYCTTKMVRPNKELNNSATVYLESPNFARISMPTDSIATPDMASPATSGQHLSKIAKTVENDASKSFQWNFWRTGPQKFTHLLGTASLINLPDMTSLAASGQPQNAIKYYTKMRKTGAVGIEAHNFVTVWGKVTSNGTLNLTERLSGL